MADRWHHKKDLNGCFVHRDSVRLPAWRPQCSDRRNVFVVSVHALPDCSSDAVSDNLYLKMHDLLSKAGRRDIVLLAGDMNT